MSTGVNDLYGEIIVFPYNEMEAIYGVLEIHHDSLASNIDIHNITEMRSEFTVQRHDETEIFGNIVIPTNTNIQSTLTVAVYDSLSCSIDISFSNQMSVVYDAVPIPKEQAYFYPIKDAFVRSAVPRLNYGGEHDIFVGYYSGYDETYRGLMSFDLHSLLLPEGHIISGVKLRLYQFYRSQSTQENADTIELLKIDNNWAEYGITWANQPSAEEVIGSMELSAIDGYYELDVTEYVLSFLQNLETNPDLKDFGFLIKSLDETTNVYRRFGTKESDYRPTLIVEHYNPLVYSGEKVSIPGTVRVGIPRISDLLSHTEVKSYFSGSDLHCTIKFSYQLDCRVTVSKDNLFSKVSAARAAYDTLNASVEVRLKGLHEMPSRCVISTPEIPSEIVVLERSNLTSILEIRRSESLGINSHLVVSNPNLLCIAEVLYRDNLNSFVTVKRYNEADLLGNLKISNRLIYGHLTPVIHNNLPSTVGITGSRIATLPGKLAARRSAEAELPGYVISVHHSDLIGSVAAVSGYLKSKLEVRQQGSTELRGHVRNRKTAAGTLSGAVIAVIHQNLSSVVRVRQSVFENLPSVVRIRRSAEADLPARIMITLHSSFPGVCAVRQHGLAELNSLVITQHKTDLVGSVQVVSGWLKSIVDVIYRDESDLSGHTNVHNISQVPSYVTVRQKSIRNLPGRVSVRQYGSNNLHAVVSSLFRSDILGSVIVRQFSRADLNSLITVRQRGAGDLYSHLYVTFSSDINCNVIVQRREVDSIYSTIIVRQTSVRTIPAHIIPKIHAHLPSSVKVLSGWLRSSIRVVTPAESDIPTNVTVAVTDDLPCLVATRHNSELPAEVDVRTRWVSDLYSTFEVLQSNTGFIVFIM
jgi:hypothetical protein